MKLIIDIGNSCAKLAVFKDKELIEVFRDSNQSLDSLPLIQQKYPISHGLIASVVTLSPAIREQLNALNFNIVYFTGETPTPLINLYKTPHTLGSDRLAAAVGAYDRSPGKDLLIIDAGTALTYEFVNAKGEYIGGNISPGLQMRIKSLNQFTSKLPLVSATGAMPPLFGYDTETAIRAGVIKGMEMEMSGYIMFLKNKYPELLVFLTGGDTFSFDTNLKSIIFADSFLVLKGLNRILDHNDRI